MKRTAMLTFILLSMNISMCGNLTPGVRRKVDASMHLAALLAGVTTCYWKYTHRPTLSKNYLGGLLIVYSIVNLLKMYVPEEENKVEQVAEENNSKKNINEINPRIAAT